MDDKKDIPYVAFESSLSREERHSKRLWFALILVVVLWFITILGGIWYNSLQVETYEEVSQEAEDIDGNVTQHIGDSYGEDKTN